jgi:hypothetical protein
LNESKLPKAFWGEALRPVNHILNIAPSEALPADTMPYEQLERCKPDYSALHVFGCCAFAHVGKDKHKSLDLHTTPCVFLGYPDNKGWCLWDPCTKCIIILHDVNWNENKLPGTSTIPVPLLSVVQDESDAEEDSCGESST